VRLARTAAWSGSGGKCSDRYCRSGPLYLQRTRVESVAERKLRRRPLTEEGNVEIWRTALAKCQVGTGDRRESVSNLPKAVVRSAPWFWALLPQRPIQRWGPLWAGLEISSAKEVNVAKPSVELGQNWRTCQGRWRKRKSTERAGQNFFQNCEPPHTSRLIAELF